MIENIYISGKSLKTVKPDAFSGISENAVFHITASKKRYNKIVNQINNSEIADTVKFERKKVK